jgi:enoyl-CoA hydratase
MTAAPHSTRHAGVALTADGVATLTITEAKSLNILGSAVIRELTEALERLAAHPQVRVVVLRGSGDKAFVGGADIHEMAQLTPPTAETFIAGLAGLCEAARSMPMPTIARLPGWCLGGGLELAMACDLRIASTDAHFGMPEVAVGIPSVIHAALMPRLIGGARAAWMVLTGESIDASTALDWGLVNEVVDLSQLDTAIAVTAGKLAAMGPAALRSQKRLLRWWDEMPIEQAVATSVAEFGRAFETDEPRRYMAPFVARRKKD